MLYPILKDAHNILRWLVVLAAFWALFRAYKGLFTKSAYTATDRSSGLIFSSVLNLQFVLGILLYAFSPLTSPIFTQGFKYAMSDPMIRFFAVEHPFMMLIAVLIAQTGYSRAKRAPTDRSKFLRSAVAYSLATLLILTAIPWPWMKFGRNLLPFP